MGVTAENVVLLGRVVVNFDVVLVVVEHLGDGLKGVVLRVSVDRRRIQRRIEQRLGNRIDHAGGNPVEGEGSTSTRNEICRRTRSSSAGAGIVKLVGNLIVLIAVPADSGGVKAAAAERSKIPPALRRGKDVEERSGGWVVETLSLVVKEEEELVLDYGAADSAAEHVPAQRRTVDSGVGEIIFPAVGVQHIVAEILPQVAMESVGPRLDGGADNAPLEVAELCGGVAGDEVEFLNGIGCGGVAQQVIRNLIVVHAVQQEVVRLLAIAIDVGPGAAGGVIAVIEIRRVG